MNKEKLKIVGLIALVLLLVAGTFVGNIYFNIPMEAFPYIFSLAAMILVGIGRVFSKGEEKPLPKPTHENILRSKLAVSAGIAGLAVIFGIGIGLHTISYFEKIGKNPSPFWLFAVLIGVPIAALIFFFTNRSRIIKDMSNRPLDADRG